jgi:hypothetical protein
MSPPLPALFLGPTTEHVPHVPDANLFALKAGEKGRVRNFTVESQQPYVTWCWAGVAAGVINSYRGAGATSRDQVARQVLGRRYPADEPQLLHVVLGDHFASPMLEVDAGDATPERFEATIKREIDAQRPVCAEVVSGIVHYVGIAGYRVASRDDIELLIQDPADDDPDGRSYVLIHEFMNNYNQRFGWSRTFRTKSA